MLRLIAATLIASVLLVSASVRPTAASERVTATEAAFVRQISADLTARFPTPEAARKAGYLRFTDEDETGAISYANRVWTSVDAAHPSQLWFDVRNRLIGADYSVAATSAKPPNLFGVKPERWHRLSAHAHYGLVGTSNPIYGGVDEVTLERGGATVAAPTKAALVKAGIAKKIADVRFVFAFPAIWDLSVWVIPNSNGAFADKNPAVKPTSPKSAM
ncbi:MAG: hypothetical protein NVS4B5_13050 [Vulcanimicrobiaceae bacterium]